MAGKPELFAPEPDIQSHDDAVLVALAGPDGGGIFTVARFDGGQIVRMDDFASRRKAEKALRSGARSG